MKVDRFILGVAAVAGFTAVAAGAFGAHGLEKRFAHLPERLIWWETGARYHLAHALALVCVALAGGDLPLGRVQISAGLFATGIVLFSGSLYAMAVSGESWLGAVTPVGGFLLLGGWLALLAAAFTPRRSRHDP